MGPWLVTADEFDWTRPFELTTRVNGDVRQHDTTTGFSTTVQSNPWDIFAGNVAARYYF